MSLRTEYNEVEKSFTLKFKDSSTPVGMTSVYFK